MFTVDLSGSLQVDPKSVTGTQAELFASLDLAFKATYAAAIAGNLPISGTFVVPLGAISKVRALAVRSADGQSLVVRVSSAAGNDQAIPLSGPLVLVVDNPGDELTAVSVVGTGRIEYLVAGNQT